MSDDVISLYSRRILALATEIPLTGRLDDPMGSAKRRSPQCGSTVTVDLDVVNGSITAFRQNVLACALGQASASLLGQHVMGLDRAQLESGRGAMAAMLKEGVAPTGQWEELEVLSPAREYANRHASIMLAWEASLDAFDEAMKKAG